MKFNIDVGHPEILLICGTYLMTSGYFGFGLTLVILGFLGGIFRSGLRIQRQQQELEAKEKLFREMSDAGEELGDALTALFGAFSKDTSKKNNGGQVH